jgi:FlaG/FlaF family flagellin (archaellin)
LGNFVESVVRVKRPCGSNDGISPLVSEVILVAICVVMSGVILVAAGGISPDSGPAPHMAFSKAECNDGQVKLVLSQTVPGTEFIQFKLVVYPPESLTPMEATFTDASSYQLNGTMTMNLVDLGQDGEISNGDYLTIQSSGSMEPGEWDFYMIYLSDGSVTASISAMV